MDILIAGDIVPINSNEKLFITGSLKKHFSDFNNVFNTSDLFIANLECPLTGQNKKINKSGPSLKANPDTIAGIAKLNVNLASLANNHIGDYGESGVSDTIELLKRYKIDKIGAGFNSIEAMEPYIYEKDGNKVGVLSYADYEFGIVTDTKFGANPFNLINAYNNIKALKAKVDYIIVLLHDGKEYYPYPSPELQEICQHLVDLGSDIVVCQHSHIIGSVETYKSGTIVYGQGNFIFDYRNNQTPDWSNGFFIKIKLNKTNKLIEFIPFKQNYPGISKLTESEEKSFFATMKERATKVSDKIFIEKSWNNFINSQSANYMSSAFGHHMVMVKILKKTGLYNYIVSNKVTLIVLNFLRSRVHREVFIAILEKRINNKMHKG